MVTKKTEIFEILDELKDNLKELGVRRIGLFGSFARNDSTSESDVEVITEESLSPYLKKRN